MSYEIFAYKNLETQTAFLNAHTAIWTDKGVGSLTIQEQIDAWWERYKVRIAGGPYDPEWAADKVQKVIVMEFESEAAFFLFMLEWS